MSDAFITLCTPCTWLYALSGSSSSREQTQKNRGKQSGEGDPVIALSSSSSRDSSFFIYAL